MMDKKENWVKLHIPKGFANEEPNLMVGINGKNYLLPRGKESLVPSEVAKEVSRALAAQEKLDAAMDRLAAK